MTLTDLKALQPSKRWKHFIYLTENQTADQTADPMKVSLTFDSMEIYPAPLMNTLYLMGMGNYIEFTAITAIQCKPHILGDVITLTCRNGKRYTIIAQ